MRGGAGGGGGPGPAPARGPGARAGPGGPPPRGVEDLPYVELARASRRRWYYDLEADGLSRLPSGPFRLGTRKGGWLQVARSDEDRTVRDADAGEAPSEGRCVTDDDRAAGVVYVQAAPR